MASLKELAVTQYVEGALLSWATNGGVGYIADQVIGKVTVGKTEGKLLERDASGTYTTISKRAPGDGAGEVESGFKAGASYQTEDRTLKERVTEEDRAAASGEFGIDAYRVAAEGIVERWMNEREQLVSALFRSTDPYSRVYSAALGHYASYSNQVVTLTGTSHWDNSASKPFTDLKTARLWFSANSYQVPNTIIIPEKVAIYLREHPDYISEYGEQRDLQEVAALHGSLRGLNVLTPTAKGTDALGATVPYWGNDVWIGRIDPGMRGFAVEVEYSGGSKGVKVWPDPYPDRKTDYVQVEFGQYDWVVPQAGGSTCGYLIRNVISDAG